MWPFGDKLPTTKPYSLSIGNIVILDGNYLHIYILYLFHYKYVHRRVGPMMVAHICSINEVP
jgi:hypothetical protein